MNEIFSHTITNPRDGINKDRFLIKENWFTVCDGVSSDGIQGTKAAEIAIEFVKNIELASLKTKRNCEKFFLNLSFDVTSNCKGSTTFTSGFIKNGKLVLIHTGDSECRFIYKNGEVQEITIPFTVAYGRYLANLIKREEVSRDIYSNVLTDCLGQYKMKAPQSQIETFDLADVNFIVFNSDGANYCLENQMIEICKSNTRNPAKEICETALKQGSRDDITVIVVKLNN